jgi:hypothetical protein
MGLFCRFERPVIGHSAHKKTAPFQEPLINRSNQQNYFFLAFGLGKSVMLPS